MDTRALAFLVVLGIAWGAGASPHCVPEGTGNVDWFVAMKMPYDPDSSNPLVQTGYAYAYADSQSPEESLTSRTLDSSSSPASSIQKTLNYLYDGDSEVGYILYNDEFDGKKYNNRAHAKGVLVFDKNGGFWLIHSTPRWPPRQSEGYEFGDFAKEYGQSFLCINFDLKTINDIGMQLQYDWPHVYDSNIPSSIAGDVPNLQPVIDGDHIAPSASQQTRIQNYVSTGGQSFQSFAKSAAADIELYYDLVAPTLDCDLLIETWMRDPALPSYCKPTYKYDIVEARQLAISGVDYPETKDHSKWAVGLSSSCTTVCVGDINRMSSQASRGGGTMCWKNAQLWRSLSGMITDEDKC